MAKAIFFNIPASGHVNPSLPLTAELVRRGEQVIYYNTVSYRKVIEATGATFRPYATITDTFFDERKLDGSNPPLAAAIMVATCRDLLPELLDAVRSVQPDYVLYDSMCLWGAWVARILKLPSVTSQALGIVPPGALFSPAMLRIAAGMLLRGMPHLRRFSRISSEIGKQYGVKALAVQEAFNAPADLTISYTSAEFQIGSDKIDKQVRFVGTTLMSRADAPDFPLEQLDGKPVIYISLGTLINTNVQFFKDCTTAFADSPYTVVMAIGSRLSVDALGAIPANFIVRNYVPQTEIVKRAALFISHGGMNSVHDALYLGVPLLIVPQQAEQTMTAARVEHFGAGVRLDQPTPASLRQTAERILNDPSYRENADKIGKTLRDAGGAPHAADLILDMVREKAG
jgi:MGT family glycosyltransferase